MQWRNQVTPFPGSRLAKGRWVMCAFDHDPLRMHKIVFISGREFMRLHPMSQMKKCYMKYLIYCYQCCDRKCSRLKKTKEPWWAMWCVILEESWAEEKYTIKNKWKKGILTVGYLWKLYIWKYILHSWKISWIYKLCYSHIKSKILVLGNTCWSIELRGKMNTNTLKWFRKIILIYKDGKMKTLKWQKILQKWWTCMFSLYCSFNFLISLKLLPKL